VFTALAIVGVSVIAWRVSREQGRDSDDVRTVIKQSRQDLRLIVMLLYGIIIMLGVIADLIRI
jgi:hypothetical protein